MLMSKKAASALVKALFVVAGLVGITSLVLAAVALSHLRILETAHGTGSVTGSVAGAGAGARAGPCAAPDAASASLVAEVERAYRDVVRGNARFVATGAWEDFTERVPDLETAAAHNNYLRSLADLARRARGVADSRLVRGLDAVLNLSALDALFMQTGSGSGSGSGLRADPWVTAHRALGPLPALALANSTNFAPRVLSWLANLCALAERWPAYAQRGLAAGHVHAHAALVATYETDVGPALSADYSGMCAAAFGASATLRDACRGYASVLEERLADFRTWWRMTYMPRAAELRPDASAGLRNVANGTRIYAILLEAYGARRGTNASLDALASEASSVFAALAPTLLPGHPAPDGAVLARALADGDDARFHRCLAPDAAAAATEYARAAPALIVPDFGFASGAPLVVRDGAAAEAVFVPGRYDASERAWRRAGVASLGASGVCPNGHSRYPQADLRLSALARLAPPGEALRRTLLIEEDGACALAAGAAGDLADARDPAAEAWALFAEGQLASRGFFRTPLARAGIAQSRALAAAAGALDQCLHRADSARPACTLVDADNILQTTGATAFQRAALLTRALLEPGFATAVADVAAILQDRRAAAPAEPGASFFRALALALPPLAA